MFLSAISTFAEIEAAVKTLPRSQQEELFAVLAERIRRPSGATGEDSFERVIGAFTGPREATGRKAEGDRAIDSGFTGSCLGALRALCRQRVGVDRLHQL